MDSTYINQLKNDIENLNGNMLNVLSTAVEFEKKLNEAKLYLNNIPAGSVTSLVTSKVYCNGNSICTTTKDERFLNFLNCLKDKVHDIKLKSIYADTKLDDMEKFIFSINKTPECLLNDGDQININDSQINGKIEEEQLLNIDFEDLPDEEFHPQKSDLEDHFSNKLQNANNLEINKLQQQVINTSKADKYSILEVFNENSQKNTIEEIKWLTQVIPYKFPYYPQVGDQLVYFHQGHRTYLEAVLSNHVYVISDEDKPWILSNIQAQEFVKVVDITFEMDPWRACLQLQIVNEIGVQTSVSFKIKYHDMKGIVDFLILKQHYDYSLERIWKVGSRFRCGIGKTWFFGTIISKRPFDNEYPDSQFKCYHIKWDDNDREDALSPWELEPVDDLRLPKETDDTVAILREETLKLLYQPEFEDWPLEGRDATCQKIICDLDSLMTIAIIKPFIVLNSDSSYSTNVDYPVDLTIIRNRLRNRFYRHLSAIIFDAKYIEKNINTIKYKKIKIASLSETMNRDISSTCKIVTKTLLAIIKKPKTHNICNLVGALENFEELPDESFIDDNQNEYESTQSSQSQTQMSVLNQPLLSPPWKSACTKILEILYKSEYSTYFREVENLDDNLSIVAEEHEVGNYDSPLKFEKNVKRLFINCKNKTTNKEAKTYKDCIELEQLFDNLMEPIVTAWRSPQKNKNSMSPIAGPSRRHSDSPDITPIKRRRINLIEDDSEDIADDTTNDDSLIDDESDVTENEQRSADGSGVKLLKLRKFGEIRRKRIFIRSKPFTPSHELKFDLRPKVKSSVVYGIVEAAFETESKYSKRKQETFQLFKFVITNSDGIKIQCIAWEIEAIHYGDKVKVGKIICINNPMIVAANPTYNLGNVFYEFQIWSQTDIYIESNK